MKLRNDEDRPSEGGHVVAIQDFGRVPKERVHRDFTNLEFGSPIDKRSGSRIHKIPKEIDGGLMRNGHMDQGIDRRANVTKAILGNQKSGIRESR